MWCIVVLVMSQSQNADGRTETKRFDDGTPMPECNVEGCADEAVASLVGEDGYANAYRCLDCLCLDLGLRAVAK